MSVRCSYCLEDIESEDALDEHLPDCEKKPYWIKVGLEREGWDIPPEPA